MEIHNLIPSTPNGRLYTSARHICGQLHKCTDREIKAHIHDYYEVYFNISGDVALIVEGNRYGVSPGDMIITMPNEIHYIIANSDCYHEAYCLWFNGDGEFLTLLEPFRERKRGEMNKISLDEADAEKMRELLEKIAAQPEKSNGASLESLYCAVNALALIAEHKDFALNSQILPETLKGITEFILSDIGNASIDEISKRFFISRSSLNRMFKSRLGTSPSRFIEDTRLAQAKVLLKRGCSVQSAFEQCGFADYSHFIALFKRRFGITPLKYKKQNSLK